MQFFRSKVNYTADDAGDILSKSVDELSRRVQDEVYVTSSGTGLVTGSQIRQSIEAKLNGQGRTSVRLLSADRDIDISADVVDRILSEIKTNDFYIGDNIVFTRGEVSLIRRTLLNDVAESKFVDMTLFCATWRIHRAVLNWILSEGNYRDEVQVIEDTIVSREYFASVRRNFVDQLNDLNEITNLSDVAMLDPAGPVVPDTVKRLVVASVIKNSRDSSGNTAVNGSFEAGEKFVPTSYRELHLSQALNGLRERGLVTKQELKAAGISDVTRLQDTKAMALDTFVVSHAFVDNLKAQLQSELASHGYVDLSKFSIPELESPRDRDVLMGDYLLTSLGKGSRVVGRGSNKFVLSTAAEKDLKQRLVRSFEEKASATDAAEVLKSADTSDFGKPDLFTVKELVLKSAKMPNEADVVDEWLRLVPEMPRVVATEASGSPSLVGDAQRAYQSALVNTINTLIEEQYRDAIYKLLIYTNGIKTIKDQKLQTTLLSELTSYSSSGSLSILQLDRSTPSISTFEKYAADGGACEESVLETTREQMISAFQQQLKRTSDAALLLHLATVVVHSKLICTQQPGLLRMGGKNVPKILKVLQQELGDQEEHAKLLEDFILLKNSIVKKGAEDAPSKKELILRVRGWVELVCKA